jgi:hypothetical protein
LFHGSAQSAKSKPKPISGIHARESRKGELQTKANLVPRRGSTGQNQNQSQFSASMLAESHKEKCKPKPILFHRAAQPAKNQNQSQFPAPKPETAL